MNAGASLEQANSPKVVTRKAAQRGRGALMALFWYVLLSGIFSIINHWNEFVLPLIYLHSTDKWTMAIGLQGFSDLYSTQWHWLMAASTVMVLPLIVLFFSAQSYFMEGIHMTGIAGR